MYHYGNTSWKSENHYCPNIIFMNVWIPFCLIIFEPRHEISNNGMCHQLKLQPACAQAQSDQSLSWSLEYFMTVKLLTEQHTEFLSLKKATQAHLSLHLSKCHIVGNFMSLLIYECLNTNGVAGALKKLLISKGDYCIKQWFSTITPLFEMGTSLKGQNLLPEWANSFL